MDKQEKEKLISFIEKEKENITLKHGKYNQTHFGFIWGTKLIEFIEQLDEPQKVKVKQFVADWFEEHKDFLELSLGMITPDIRTKIAQGQALSEFEKWFNRTRNKPFETIIRMKNDYEVEEEPKYRVNIGGLYLKEPLADTNDFTISMTWNKDYAYPFDSWNMAREHASKLGGTVEKAEE